MSISTLFFIVSCLGFYKLGFYNAQNPGAAWRCCRDSSLRLWKWLMS